MNFLKKSTLGIAMTALISAQAPAGEVEVLHWWTSGGEAKAVHVLKNLLEKKGHFWEDFAVAGGSGSSAMTVLKTRAISGNPPTAAQMLGQDVKEWAEMGFLTNLDAVAQANHWDDVLPPMIQNVVKHDGHYVATPVNIHRANWMWSNPEVFKKSGASIPSNWDEFFVAAEKIKQAGFVPLAHGGQSWQDAHVFESMVLGIGGAPFYKKVFIDLDESAVKSATMIEVLENYKRLKPYMDRNFSGRDWNIATSMIMNGEAAMQIMGDWAKGEFLGAKKVPGEDFNCTPVPGTKGSFLFITDSFSMFKVKGAPSKKAQADLAATILDPQFQEAFNLVKGSIPARQGVSKDKFDNCALASMDSLNTSSDSSSLLPSMAHGMAVSPTIKGQVMDVVSNYFNDDTVTPQMAQLKLAKAIKE